MCEMMSTAGTSDEVKCNIQILISVYFSHWGKYLRVSTKKCNTGVGDLKT